MIDYNKQFLVDSVALLQHKRVSHMGAHQFVDHDAMRGSFSMSGTKGWQRYENDCPSYYILRCEKALLEQAAPDLPHYLAQGTPLVDLGVGTLNAVRTKSLLIASSLQSDRYVPIDASLKFCSEARRVIKEALPNIKIQPFIENFFSDDVAPVIDTPALGFLGGITIANVEAPLSSKKPTAAVVKTLRNMARIVNGGWRSFFLPMQIRTKPKTKPCIAKMAYSKPTPLTEWPMSCLWKGSTPRPWFMIRFG